MSDTAPILYLGDTLLHEAASYLAGVLHHAGIGFDYLPSDQSAARAIADGGHRLIILSDYPASTLEPAGHDAIAAAHRAGTNLLMIGGWESYHGLGGDWDDSPVAELLPVTISTEDDRINHDQVSLLRAIADHPILAGLPWNERPPAIGGYNRFAAKPNTQTLLEVVRQQVHRDGDGFVAHDQIIDPMLVVGDAGTARVACLATDAAPHWVGPLVDWGTTPNDPATRVASQAPNASPVEVGRYYAAFFTQLVQWCMGN